MIAQTPAPPYYAVIFTSKRTEIDRGYGQMAERMKTLASQQEGFLGMESARDELGITVSYWRDEASINKWKAEIEHKEAQRLGKEWWYSNFQVRVCKVERDYTFTQ